MYNLEKKLPPNTYLSLNIFKKKDIRINFKLTRISKYMIEPESVECSQKHSSTDSAIMCYCYIDCNTKLT